jgi:hypothetical protein
MAAQRTWRAARSPGEAQGARSEPWLPLQGSVALGAQRAGIAPVCADGASDRGRAGGSLLYARRSRPLRRRMLGSHLLPHCGACRPAQCLGSCQPAVCGAVIYFLIARRAALPSACAAASQPFMGGRTAHGPHTHASPCRACFAATGRLPRQLCRDHDGRERAPGGCWVGGHRAGR